MTKLEKLQEATMLVLQGKLKLQESNEVNTYKITYNDGAIQRTRVPNETKTVKGTKQDLMNALDDMYVDCTTSEDDEIVSFEEWVECYEEDFDPSGSNMIISITENGKVIFENQYAKNLEDEYDDDNDD